MKLWQWLLALGAVGRLLATTSRRRRRDAGEAATERIVARRHPERGAENLVLVAARARRRCSPLGFVVVYAGSARAGDAQ